MSSSTDHLDGRLMASEDTEHASLDDDAALVERLRKGDPDAAEALARRYGPDMRRIAARVLGPNPELVDVVHEAMARAFEHIDRIRQPAQLRSWLIGTTIRVAREHIRKAARFPRLADDALPEPAVHQDPDARIELQRVFQVLETLDPDERIAFSLRYIEGMELRAVADATGVSLATVKRRIRRGARAFADAAASDPVLRRRLEGGAKWIPT